MLEKHPYIKETLKTVGKVALIAGVTAWAGVYTFGFATAFTGAVWAGYAVGATVTALGGYQAIKTAVKDVFKMRQKVHQKQQEERLDRIEKTTQKMAEKMKIAAPEMTITKTQEKATPKKPIAKHKGIMPMIFRRRKDYDRAA